MSRASRDFTQAVLLGRDSDEVTLLRQIAAAADTLEEARHNRTIFEDAHLFRNAPVVLVRRATVAEDRAARRLRRALEDWKRLSGHGGNGGQ